MTINWQVKTFKALNIDELYEILKLRIDVFVVEQTCFYPDLDDIDPNFGEEFDEAKHGEHLRNDLKVLPQSQVEESS